MGGTSLQQLYGRMVLIRRLEETLLELFSLGKLVGTTHTYIGQEANAVGVIDHLDPARDVVFSNHRCHGHYLAFTDDVDGLLGEALRGDQVGGHGQVRAVLLQRAGGQHDDAVGAEGRGEGRGGELGEQSGGHAPGR